jgi:hypothetical protein
MYFRRNLEITGAMADKKKKIRMTANEAHDKFGHLDDDVK